MLGKFDSSSSSSSVTSAPAEPILHPAAIRFPGIEPKHFAELVEDIRRRGQQQPIIADLQGRIIDGLHRYRACLKLGIEPKVERKDVTDEEARALSLSLNLHRRHLTLGQWAAIAEENATRTRGGDQTADLRNDLSMAESAKAVGVSTRSAETVREVRRKAPELLPDIKAGRLAPHAAKQIAKLPHEERGEAIAKVKQGDVKGAKAKAKGASSAQKPNANHFHAAFASLFKELDRLPQLLTDHRPSVQELDRLSADLATAVSAVAKARRSQLDAQQD